MIAAQAPCRLVHAMASLKLFRPTLPQSSFHFSRPLTSLTSLVHGAGRCTPLQAPQTVHRKLTATTSASSSSSPAAGPSSSSHRKRVVFLGTPDVAALVLEKLLAASRLPDASFEVAAVVSQPGRPKGRSRVPQPTPVQQLALASGLPEDRMLCPERATDPAFLAALRELAPDLCITAAYGNYLPTKFLAIPRHGTLNIHPSLLPAYRGAAPVQRSLQDGLAVSGVTVLYTVKEMDAGPVLAQVKVGVDPEIQAPELLCKLFDMGTDLVLSNLEAVWAGLAEKAAQPQDHAKATHAAKITREEGLLDFAQSAKACHDKVRAFAPWPGTYHPFEVADEAKGGAREKLELKVLKTRVVDGGISGSGGGSNVVETGAKGLRVVCGDGSVLELLEVQAPGRKAVAARDFVNGMKGKTLRWNSMRAASAS